MVERMLDDKIYIYDRTTLIDDFVYDFLNEKPSTLTKYKDVILAILSHCHIFHLVLDKQTHTKRFEQRGDDYIKRDMLSKIAIHYGLFYADLDNVKYIDLQPDNEENIQKIMEEFRNDRSITHCTK